MFPHTIFTDRRPGGASEFTNGNVVSEEIESS